MKSLRNEFRRLNCLCDSGQLFKCSLKENLQISIHSICPRPTDEIRTTTNVSNVSQNQLKSVYALSRTIRITYVNSISTNVFLIGKVFFTRSTTFSRPKQDCIPVGKRRSFGLVQQAKDRHHMEMITKLRTDFHNFRQKRYSAMNAMSFF